MKKTYIAGPMTGIKDNNFPAFNEAARILRTIGQVVVNPAEINMNGAASWSDAMRKDIPQLVECDIICLLPGWENSKGAKLELHIAEALGMRVIKFDNVGR